MKKRLQLTTIMLVSLIFLFRCAQENISEAPVGRFSNPYSYIGEGHNLICKEYLANYNELNTDIVAKMSKDYLIATGHYSCQNIENSNFPIEISVFTSFINNENLNKITDANWIDSLLTAYVNQGAITVERKDKTLELVDVILGAGGDTNMVNNYCANLPTTIDDTTKTQVLMTAAVYSASYRLWIGDNLGKNNHISKVQLTLLGVDAIGAAVGGLLYVAQHTITENNTWSWEDFGWQTLGWGLGASLGEALGVALG